MREADAFAPTRAVTTAVTTAVTIAMGSRGGRLRRPERSLGVSG